MNQLTIKKLKKMQPNTIIKTGTISIEDYWDSNKEMLIDFVAERGFIEDWAIYFALHNQNESEYAILSFGDKMHNIKSIRKCVPCDDKALKLYRN